MTVTKQKTILYADKFVKDHNIVINKEGVILPADKQRVPVTTMGDHHCIGHAHDFKWVNDNELVCTITTLKDQGDDKEVAHILETFSPSVYIADIKVEKRKDGMSDLVSGRIRGVTLLPDPIEWLAPDHKHNWQFEKIEDAEERTLRYNCECGRFVIVSSDRPAPKTVEDFLLERMDELVDAINKDPEKEKFYKVVRVMRELIKEHLEWPMLLQEKEDVKETYNPDKPDELRFALMQKMEWLTRDEYFKRFGREAPTAPFMKKLIDEFAKHPDFNKEWLK